MRQYQASDTADLLSSQTASADMKLTKIKAFAHNAQSVTTENAHRLQGMFAHCISALHQLENRALAGFLPIEAATAQLQLDTHVAPVRSDGIAPPSLALLEELQSVRMKLERSTFSIERQSLKLNVATQKLKEVETLLATRTSALESSDRKLAAAENNIDTLTLMVQQLSTEAAAAKKPLLPAISSAPGQAIASKQTAPVACMHLCLSSACL